jgi:hypothetical protein
MIDNVGDKSQIGTAKMKFLLKAAVTPYQMKQTFVLFGTSYGYSILVLKSPTGKRFGTDSFDE